MKHSNTRILYEKSGNKYIPVLEYDPIVHDAFPKGVSLVMTVPGGQSRRHNIDPAYAPMIAAGQVAGEAISRAVMKAADMRPSRNTELTPEEKIAWDNLVAVMGDRGRYIEWPSAREIAESAVSAMIDESVKLMDNPMVKDAYDRFLVICALVKDHQNA